MATRIAAAMAMLAFALCVAMGLAAGNSFSTTLLRALGAMVVTLFVGLVLGTMAQKMLDEGVESAKKSEFPEAKSEPRDR